MTARKRPLADALIDVAQGAFDSAAATGSMSIRGVTVVLPIEIAVIHAGDGWTVLGDVPRTVTRTAFDTDPGRLEVTWTRRDRA